MTRKNGKPEKTLDELATERSALLDELVQSEARLVKMAEVHEINISTWESVGIPQGRLSEATGEVIDPLAAPRAAYYKAHGDEMATCQRTRDAIAAVDRQVANVAYHAAQERTAELRAQRDAKLAELGAACDAFDKAHLQDRAIMDRIIELYNEANALQGQIRHIAGHKGGSLPLMHPRHALKRRFMYTEQLLFQHEAQKGQAIGKHNPAKATFREALNLHAC